MTRSEARRKVEEAIDSYGDAENIFATAMEEKADLLAALDALESAVREECAGIARDWECNDHNPESTCMCDVDIAAAIRGKR